jgi:hypothetical protein
MSINTKAAEQAAHPRQEQLQMHCQRTTWSCRKTIRSIGRGIGWGSRSRTFQGRDVVDGPVQAADGVADEPPRRGRRRARGAGGPRPSPTSLRCRDPHTVKGQEVGLAALRVYGGWADKGVSDKKTIYFFFWQKHPLNCDLYSRFTFLVITQSDGWVRREG